MPEPRVLVVDIGGNNIKVLATGADARRKTPSGPDLTPERLVEAVGVLTTDWRFERVSVGYPGAVRHGDIVLEPHNLGPGWVGFDFQAAFGKPTVLVNDAAMQALGSYEGGTMLFLGLGTGLGAALVAEGALVPLEVAHLPYRKKLTFEDHVGERGLDRFGLKSWRTHVLEVIARLRAALVADEVVLGGGNAKRIGDLPAFCRLGHNDNAFVGGFRLWGPHGQRAEG